MRVHACRPREPWKAVYSAPRRTFRPAAKRFYYALVKPAVVKQINPCYGVEPRGARIDISGCKIGLRGGLKFCAILP